MESVMARIYVRTLRMLKMLSKVERRPMCVVLDMLVEQSYLETKKIEKKLAIRSNKC